jgi:hypothetical protein
MDALPIDPVTLVDRLEPEALRERLRDLDRQSRAIRVLLRAAVARERQDLRRKAISVAPQGGAAHAG